MGNETEHLDLFNEVIHILVDMGEPVDLLSGEVRNGGHQILMFRTKGEFIGETSGIDVRSKGRVLGHILHTLPIVIDRVMEIFETLNVIFFGYDSVHFNLLRKKINITPTLTLPRQRGRDFSV
jgi:hypothetical protein